MKTLIPGGGTGAIVPRHSIFSSPVGPQVFLDPVDRPGGGDDEAAKKAAAEKEAAEKAAAEKAAADKAAAEKEAAEKAAAEAAKKKADDKKSGMSDEDAKLLKELMAEKEKAKTAATELETLKKQFEGVDPEEARKLMTAQKEAEKKAAEAAGEFDRVKQMMADEHKKEVEALKATDTEKDKMIATLKSQLQAATITNAFGQSEFIRESTVLTPAKAQKIYVEHFSIEDGIAVAYDKPAGVEGRTKLVDSVGQPLNFDAAIQRLVEADPDRDAILRSKMSAGASSKTDEGKGKKTTDTGLTGIGRIGAALEKMSAA